MFVMMNNKVYDILKWVALIVLPAIAVLYGTLAGIWGFPYSEQIPDTITAVDLFLGVVLGVSNATYHKAIK
jgi:uncharacterized membrane protein